MPVATELAVELLISALTHASELGALITNARAQGRDVSLDELDAWRAKDDVAKTRLQAHIEQARAEGR